MSLTSYRTAPPRVSDVLRFSLRLFAFAGLCAPQLPVLLRRARVLGQRGLRSREGVSSSGPPAVRNVHASGAGGHESDSAGIDRRCPRPFGRRGRFGDANVPGLGRPGGDLLSHALRRSTIGAEGFHGRVRDGIGCFTPRHSHQAIQSRSAIASSRES